MKFIKLNDAIAVNPDKISVLKVMENEIWADDTLLARYPNEYDAETDFDTFINKINGED